MTDRRRAHNRIAEINNLLSMTKDNLTIIRSKIKNLDNNELEFELKEINRLFNEVDVYRQHIDYLDYIMKNLLKEEQVTK